MHFDGTVTLGNVLTIGTIVGFAAAFWIQVGMDLKSIKAWIKAHETCNRKQIEILGEVRGSLKYIHGFIKGQAETAHMELKDRY